MALKLIKKNGSWHLDGYVMGVRVRKSTQLPATPQYRGFAERERLRVENEIIEGKTSNKCTKTFREACDDYIEWKRIEGRDTIEMQRKLDKLCEHWGNTNVTDITPASIKSYISKHWSKLQGNSIRRYLNDFRAVLGHAADSVPGWAGVKVPMPTVSDQRDMHFDKRQANEFLTWIASVCPELSHHFMTLIDTGVRLNELLGIRGTDFDLSKSVLRIRRRLIRSGKTKSRDIPLTPNMKTFAKAHEGDNGLVFLNQRGKKWNSADSASAILNKWLKLGCKEMGLPHTGADAMRVHDLRHTYAYLVASNGADIADLQYLLGHEDISQTMRYRGFIQSRATNFASNLRV